MNNLDLNAFDSVSGPAAGGRMEKQRARRREESGGGGEAYPLCRMVSKDFGVWW